MKVLNLGSLNLDYVYSVDHMVTPGETLSSSSMNTFCGGKGLNQSIALAKAGVSVYHAGMIGEDGGMLLEACKGGGVHTDLIRTIPGKSGHTIIQVDKTGQNCILLYGGANQSITKEYVDEALSHFNEGDILLLQNEINLLSYIIDAAAEKKMMIILNPSPFHSALEACDFARISMLLVNEIEGSQITGKHEPGDILDALKMVYPQTKVVLTLGGDGAMYQDSKQRVYQPSFKVQAIDTTAAGDTFTGYFISSMLTGMSIQDGLALASKAAAIAVSRQGATASIPPRSEVLESL